MRHLYPPTRFVLANTICKQLAHIISEIDEAADVCDGVDFDAEFAADPCAVLQALPFFRELADVQASIETHWNILDRIFGDGFSEAMILAWTEDKNRVRGYYLPVQSISFAQLVKDYEGVSYAQVLPGGPRGGDEEHF